MTDPLAVGPEARVTFPDVLLMAGDTGLKYLVNEQMAVPPFPAQGGEHRRVVPRAPRHSQAARHEPCAALTSVDRYSPFRERMISFRGSRLVLLGILVAPW